MTWPAHDSRVRLVAERIVTALSLAQQVQVPFLAAAIAYYAFVSVVPLLVVGFTS